MGVGQAEQRQVEAERAARSAGRLLAATRAAAEHLADTVDRSKERLEAAIERRRRPVALVDRVRRQLLEGCCPFCLAPHLDLAARNGPQSERRMH